MGVNRYQLIEEIRQHLRPEDSIVAASLPTYSLADLQMVLSNLKNRQERDRTAAATQAQEQIARDAAEIVKRQLEPERAALAEQQQQLALQAVFFHIYRTPVESKLLAQNQANEQLLLDLLNPGETPSLELFQQILADPRFTSRFVWQSA